VRYNPLMVRFRTRLNNVIKEMVLSIRQLKRLLLLTVRVGGEAIDGILLELAVLLTHLRSLEPCRI